MSRFVSVRVGFLVAAALVGTCGAAPRRVVARDWHVPAEAATIQAAVDSAVAGDVVVLAAGTYSDCTELNGNGVAHIAILRNGIHLRGATGDPADVVLDAGRLGRCLELRSFADTTRIADVTFRRGKAVDPFGSGGAVFAYAATPVFANCVFDSCEASFAGGGVNVASGGTRLTDCVFLDCSTGNIGAAVRATGSELELDGVTIFRSTGPAVHYATVQPVITRTIIAGGSAAALSRNNTADPVPDISCTDIWDNGADWSDFLAGLAAVDGNLSADPLFCNPLFGDVGLYATSPCAPGGDCGVIGARPVSCGLGAVTHVVRPDGAGDHATIQDALNAAADADTVALADGVFTGAGNRDLDYLGKGVVVRGNAADPAAVVIDCGGSALEPHRGVVFARGETRFAVLRDLTIRNADVADDGGALHITDASPRIENVVFTANHAGRGAAGWIDGGAPTFTGCEIRANEGRSFAGGFALRASEATFADCLFRANWGQRASSLYLPDSCAVAVTGTTFDGNNSAGDRACIELEGNSHLDLANCQITNGNRTALNSFDMASAAAVWTNVHGNAEGNWVGGLAGQSTSSGNLSVDPLYCDRGAGDFHLRGDSPCVSYNAGNGLPMGAFDAGCDAPAVFGELAVGLPSGAGAACGVTWLDYNGDGLVDLHVGRENGPDDLLLGSGVGLFNRFGDGADGPTAGATAAAWEDIDGDGDPDLYASGGAAGDVLAIYAAGALATAGAPALPDSLTSVSAAWGEASGDALPDLLLVRPDTTCVLLHQTAGGGSFSDVSAARGLVWEAPWSGASWVDYDNDGRLDLYLLADGAANRLLHNLAGGFSNVANVLANDAGRARSAAWADYSNDGRADLLLVNADGATRLLRQVGAGSFVAVTPGALYGTAPGRSGIWGDYDNDGDLDVFLSRCGARDQLLRNDGSDRFVDVGEPGLAASDSSTGAAWADFDNDGDLDLAVADRSGTVRLYRNNLSAGHAWLRVRPRAYGGGGATAGVKVWLRPDTGPDQVRVLGSGGGWLSRDEMVAHFGLGAATMVDSLRITWPDGRVSIRTGIAPGQVLTVVGPTPAAVPGEDPTDTPRLRAGLTAVAPNPFNPATRIRFATARPGPVDLAIYDVGGRLVRRLVAAEMAAGEHEAVWRGRDGRDRPVAAGVYFVRLAAADRHWTRAVTLVK